MNDLTEVKDKDAQTLYKAIVDRNVFQLQKLAIKFDFFPEQEKSLILSC